MTTILSLLLFLVSIMYLYFRKKYKSLLKKVIELSKPLRQGYYKYHCTQGKINIINWTPTVFVNEIDRYTNGESKISINRIEITVEDDYKFDFKTADEFVRKKFESMVKTSDITWLESEQSIKENRRIKLEQLKEIAKKVK